MNDQNKYKTSSPEDIPVHACLNDVYIIEHKDQFSNGSYLIYFNV